MSARFQSVQAPVFFVAQLPAGSQDRVDAALALALRFPDRRVELASFVEHDPEVVELVKAIDPIRIMEKYPHLAVDVAPFVRHASR